MVKWTLISTACKLKQQTEANTKNIVALENTHFSRCYSGVSDNKWKHIEERVIELEMDTVNY